MAELHLSSQNQRIIFPMQRDRLESSNTALIGLTNINIILGRNGAGKSRFLRALDNGLSQATGYNVRYISPERAGVFRKDGNVLTNMERHPNWIRQVRSSNQAAEFKAMSANFLRECEVLYLRRLQDSPSIRMDAERSFRTDRLDRINRLLSNICIEQKGADFVFINAAGEPVDADQISSGESEAVALATEITYFFDMLDITKFNVLLLDEPDVHLHPDLQA